jgi:hypothetical protein
MKNMPEIVTGLKICASAPREHFFLPLRNLGNPPCMTGDKNRDSLSGPAEKKSNKPPLVNNTT